MATTSVPMTFRAGNVIVMPSTVFNVEEKLDFSIRIEQDYIDHEIQLSALEHPKFIVVMLEGGTPTTSGHVSVKFGSNTASAIAVNPLAVTTAYDSDGMTELTSPSLYFTNDSGAAVSVHIYAGE